MDKKDVENYQLFRELKYDNCFKSCNKRLVLKNARIVRKEKEIWKKMSRANCHGHVYAKDMWGKKRNILAY